MSSPLQPPKLPASDIQIEHFELKLVWPIHVQAVRVDNGEPKNTRLAPTRNSNYLESWATWITNDDSPWEPVRREYPLGAGGAYAEYCYFHPFVRNFLYVSRDDIRHHRNTTGYEKDSKALNRNLRIFKRTDLTSPAQNNNEAQEKQATLTIEFESSGRRRVSLFEVKSCWLYLFDTQVATLELDIIHRNTDGNELLSLESAMTIQNQVRRVYAPFWQVYSGSNSEELRWWAGIGSGHHTPFQLSLQLPENKKRKNRSIVAHFGCIHLENTSPDPEVAAQDHAKWLADTLKKLNRADYTLSNESTNDLDLQVHQQDEALSAISKTFKSVFNHREPHTNAILRELMSPLEPLTVLEKGAKDKRAELQYEHIQDDRIPLMCFIGISNKLPHGITNTLGVRTITDGDWLRLSQLDRPGSSMDMPYSKEFLDNQCADVAKYSYDRFWDKTGHFSNRDSVSWQSTRWLISEVAFLAVGNADDKAFFMDGDGGALCHFRRHYFAMFLIATFHRSSLLQFKHRLAEISDALLEQGNEEEREQKFKTNIERLQKEFMRFRTLYWFAEVSNQTQPREMFALMRRHNNIEKLFLDVQDDIEAASNVVTAAVEQRRGDAAHGLGIAAGFLAVLAPAILWIEKRLDATKSPIIDAVVLGGISLFIITALYIFAMRFGQLRDAWYSTRIGRWPLPPTLLRTLNCLKKSTLKRPIAWMIMIASMSISTFSLWKPETVITQAQNRITKTQSNTPKPGQSDVNIQKREKPADTHTSKRMDKVFGTDSSVGNNTTQTKKTSLSNDPITTTETKPSMETPINTTH